MTPRRARPAAIAAAVVLAARLLAWLTPAPAELLGTLSHPQQAVLGAGVDSLALAAASAACWLALTWLVLALTALAAAGLPGRCGRLGDRIAAATVPATARRLIAITLGLTVVTATGPAPAMAGSLAQPRPAASAPDLDWPVAAGRSASAAPRATRPPSAPARIADRSSRPAEVVVRRGDSLWTIARRHLPPGASDAQVAAHWPRWYAANRSVVGADPDLLLPGQRLVPPDDSSGGQP